MVKVAKLPTSTNHPCLGASLAQKQTLWNIAPSPPLKCLTTHTTALCAFPVYEIVIYNINLHLPIPNNFSLNTWSFCSTGSVFSLWGCLKCKCRLYIRHKQTWRSLTFRNHNITIRRGSASINTETFQTLKYVHICYFVEILFKLSMSIINVLTQNTRIDIR